MLLDSTPPSVLQTSFHLRWAMEAIGQAFSLPLEDERIINAAIEIYRRWALVPAKQPPCWSQGSRLLRWRIDSRNINRGAVLSPAGDNAQFAYLYSSLIFAQRSSPPPGALRAGYDGLYQYC